MMKLRRHSKCCFLIVVAYLNAYGGVWADCPQQPTGPNGDTQIPKSMYLPSWPKSQDVFMRVVKADPSRVTPWLNSPGATSGIDLFDAASLQLPPGSTIVDASVRLRAVEKRPQGTASGYPI